MFVFEKQRTVLFFYRVNYPPPKKFASLFFEKIYRTRHPLFKRKPAQKTAPTILEIVRFFKTPSTPTSPPDELTPSARLPTARGFGRTRHSKISALLFLCGFVDWPKQLPVGEIFHFQIGAIFQFAQEVYNSADFHVFQNNVARRQSGVARDVVCA